MLNDYLLIEELRIAGKQELYAKLNALGNEAAELLAERGQEAVARHRHLIVLTHVPPFRESCWHEGKISSDDYLPHFSCRAVGDRLGEIMRAHPERTMIALCGHTHGAGYVRILENLEVRTGGAIYGVPELQEVLELG